MANSNYEVEFVSMVVSFGLEAPKHVIADGKLHRFSSNGKHGDKSGYYVLFTNPDGSVAGKWGCWRSLDTQTWSSKNNSTLTLAGRLELKEQQRKANTEVSAALFDRISYAKDLLKKSIAAEPSHPYIQKKGDLPIDGVYSLKTLSCSSYFNNTENKAEIHDVLLIPISDKKSRLQSIQAIDVNGKKMFMSGGKTTGGMFTFKGNTEQVYVAEGFATAGTIHKITGNTVVCAFNANNLKHVAPLVKEQFPDSEVIVAADNDHKKEREGKENKGLSVAKELFAKKQIAYTYPTFECESNGSDWNDFALEHGFETTKEALVRGLTKPKEPINSFAQAIEILSGDNDASEAYDKAIYFIKEADQLKKSRMMKKLKETTGVTFKDIQTSITQLKYSEQPEQLSHGQIAHKLIDSFSDVSLIAAYGQVWSYDEDTGLWSGKKLSYLGNVIAKQFEDQDKCQRVSDYKAIANFVYDLQEEQSFFDDAPHGITIPSGFLFVDNNYINLCAHSALQRSRHRLSFDPAPRGTLPTLFLNMLHEAFEGFYPDEQIRQLRMVFGLSLFGLLPKHQMAVLLHGAGGSGKSVVLKVLENLVSMEAIATVSPMQMDKDYKVATLAGKRFNLVPEIEKDSPIPSSAFKAIIGSDTINAREPYGKAFNFTPTVANWFNGNFYPKNTDHTFGFYRRWCIVHFHNSKPLSERDPLLLERIINNELPAILTWAIDGIEDYLQQSFDVDSGTTTRHSVFLSQAHSKCLAKWMSESDSVKGWLTDGGENGIIKRERGSAYPGLKESTAYSLYKDWCVTSGIKPLPKTEFSKNMEICGYIAAKPQNTKTYMSLAKTPNDVDVLFGKAA